MINKIFIGLFCSMVGARAALAPFPPTGFVKFESKANFAEISGSGEASDTSSIGYLKILKKITAPITCSTLEFVNLPKPNYSPFAGENKFELMAEPVNGKLGWSNGREYLTYVLPTSDDSGGTWIVGVEPGVDNGYIFLKPAVSDSQAMTPIDLQTDEAQWHWLQKQNWVVQPNLRVICLDDNTESETNSESGSHGHYHVEYYQKETQRMADSHLIVSPYKEIIPYIESMGRFPFPESHISTIPGILLDRELETWITLSSMEVIAEYGAPVVIIQPGEEARVGHIVNDEHGWEGSWRMTLKSQIPDKNGKKMAIVELNGLTGFAVNGPSILAFGASAQHKALENSYLGLMTSSLSNVVVGESLWLFYSEPHRSSSVEIDQLLLECVRTTDDSAVFEYTLSDRRLAMDHPILKIDTDYVVMQRTKEGLMYPKFTFRGESINVHGGFNLGSYLVHFIKDYLITMEGALSPDLSSCYFYHAAVSLPKALVYAAEIICVLIGAKPITLIQYTTPTDHQWKHKLVRQLSRGVVQTKLALGDAFPIDYQITKFVRDETLVIYRSNRKYLVDSLLPYGQAQALHPAPYPDPQNPRPDEERQIYYAWWNGFVLGYPEHFVDSYCQTFHNGLTEQERVHQSKRAKRDVYNHFRTLIDKDKQQQHLTIKMGNDPSIAEDLWPMVVA